MSVRVQVIVSQEERERFRHAAARVGVSLSSWLRQAGLSRLAAQGRRRITSRAELAAFFEECRQREADQGSEPEWEEHLAAIERSKGRGGTGT